MIKIGKLTVSDNFFSKEDNKVILDYCKRSPYYYGEKDDKDTPPCGMVHDILKHEHIYNFISNKIEEVYPDVKKMNLYRMYVNCFSPAEKPYFHTDGPSGLTFIYYANDEEWNINDGGETQFYSGGILTGLPPITNRMAIFPPDLLHCATSFRDRHKFTVAIKYEDRK